MSEGRRQRTGRVAPTLVSLLIGTALGLLIGFEMRPVPPTEANPADLRSSYKDDYIRMISAAYLLNGDLNAAKERLAQLGITDPALVAGGIAPRDADLGSSMPGSDVVLKLAAALATGQPPAPRATSTLPLSETTNPTSTPVDTVLPSATPSLASLPTEVLSSGYTVTPTRDSAGTATAPFTAAPALDSSLTPTEATSSTPGLDPTSTLPPSSSAAPLQTAGPVAPLQTAGPVAPLQTAGPVAPLQTAGPVAPLVTAEPGAQTATQTALPTATETTLSTASPAAIATATQPPTETPTLIPTAPLPTATFAPTPLPTLPPVAPPTQSAPGFQLIGRAMLTCLDNPETGNLRFYVRDRSGQELPNVQVEVRWSSGEDTFYTGLKPERGVGYADFEAVPNTYSVALANGASDLVTGLVVAGPPPNCSSDRGVTPRGWKLTFQQK